ncbi:MAG: molybdopterin molybdenumtransferase MoeA, partial [Alphaproteobacteria bacterium]
GAAPRPPHRFRVRAAFAHAKKAGRREWLRAHLEADDAPDGHGGWRAVKYPAEGAGILSSLVAADGLVELPEDLTDVAPGTVVDFLPFSEVWT